MQNEEKQEGVDVDLSNKQKEELANSVENDINALPYRPASEKCQPIGAATPTKLYYEIQYALAKMKEMGIETTEYVKEKLGYSSNLAVCTAFAAEQVDALALAIFQIENGYSFILGDGTGIGKGRVCAGIMRYAYQKGLIPAFITFKSSLFSDIYRDIIDIGGFDSEKTIPMPFYLLDRGGKANKKEIEEGTASEVIYKNDIVFQNKVLYHSDIEFDALKEREKEKKKKAKQKGKPFSSDLPPSSMAYRLSQLSLGSIPSNYRLIIGTYSGFQGNVNKSNRIKIIRDYFIKNQKNVLLIFDECHAAAGKGLANINISAIKNTEAKIFFSSATFAKTVDNLTFYVSRTAINDSGVSEAKIYEFVNSFKDNALEFISQGVAESGQMIRRERTLEGCELDFDYPLDDSDIQSQYDKYDKMVGILSEIRDFHKSSDFKAAVDVLVRKIASEKGFKIPHKECPKNEKEAKAWRVEFGGRGFYEYASDFGKTVKNRNSWIESLLFSLKVDSVAKAVIKRLQNKSEYETRSGSETKTVSTYTKPLVSLRNTGDSLIALLGKKDGDEISDEEMDFSYTLRKVLEECLVGKITFKEIVAPTTDDDYSDEEKEQDKIVFNDMKIELDSFKDKGVKYKSIEDTILSTKSGLPISPIDALIEKVSSVTRNEDDYEFAQSAKFIIEDTTSRRYSIVKENGKNILRNRVQGANVVKIEKFNSGKVDAIIINVAASTGSSFHSSSLFADKRRRSMIIHQVELDVSTETQKMGRINRTGQVNFPEYCYVISAIPSEVRRLMALRRKMKSLSANTTGNMNQAASASEIKDGNGKPIEDIFNKYGYHVIKDYCSDHPEFESYLQNYSTWVSDKGDINEKVDIFTLALELAPSAKQKKFYDDVNAAFIALKSQKKKEQDWDFDSNIINYKASIKNKAVIFEDTGENAFKSPVYENDIYVSSMQEPYTKEKMQEQINKYCGNKDPYDFQKELVENIKTYKFQFFEKELSNVGQYNLDEAENEEDKKWMEEENAAKTKSVSDRVDSIFDWLIELIDIAYEEETERSGSGKSRHKALKIGEPCLVPFDEKKILELNEQLEREYDKDFPRIEEIEAIKAVLNSQQVVLAKFLGIKIDSKDGKLNPSNMTFCFACLDGLIVEMRLKPTKINKQIFDFIGKKTRTMPQSKKDAVEVWELEYKPRLVIKSITGNLLRAYDSYIKKARPTDKLKICSYTNIDGSIEKGIIVTNPIGVTEIGGRDFLNPYSGLVSISGLEVTGNTECDFYKIEVGKGIFIGANRFVVSYIEGKRKMYVVSNPSDISTNFSNWYPALDFAKFVPINDAEIVNAENQIFYIDDGKSKLQGGALKVLLGKASSKKSDFAKYENSIVSFCSEKGILFERMLVKKFEYFNYDNMKVETYTSRAEVPVLSVNFTQELADYVYEISKLTVQIGTKVTFSYKSDEFKKYEGDKPKEEESKKGIFKYAAEKLEFKELQVPYKEQRGFVSFVKDSSFPNGLITYSYELTAAEALSAYLMPVMPNYDNAFAQVVTRLKQVRKLERFYEFVRGNQDNPNEIQRKASDYTNFSNLKYVFGNIPMVRIGQILVAKVLSTEIPTEAPREKFEEKQESTIILLNLDSAQDFLIKFAE